MRFIFDEYVKGNGARVIAHKLEAMGALTTYGCKHWQETTIIGIIRNEKYMGDLVQGKTFTVDPISHRRLENQGEVNKYVVKDHHEAMFPKKYGIKHRQFWRSVLRRTAIRWRTRSIVPNSAGNTRSDA